MKDYVPRETPEHEYLHVVFLDIINIHAKSQNTGAYTQRMG